MGKIEQNERKTMGNGWQEGEEERKRREGRNGRRGNTGRGIGREPLTETKTEGENAPPLCSFSALVALACVKCKAAG